MHRFPLSAALLLAMVASMAQADEIICLMPDDASRGVTVPICTATDSELGLIQDAIAPMPPSVVLGFLEVSEPNLPVTFLSNDIWSEPVTNASHTSRPYSSIFDPRHVIVCFHCNRGNIMISMNADPTGALPSSITPSQIVIGPSVLDRETTLIAELPN